jgi:hypothetical protein
MATITDAWEFEKLCSRIKDERAKGSVEIITESNDGNYIEYHRKADGADKDFIIKYTEMGKTSFETFPLNEYLDRILRKGENGKLQLHYKSHPAERQGRGEGQDCHPSQDRLHDS